MSFDIELLWQPRTSAASGYADFAIAGGDLKRDNDLKTAVLLSLFTDRRAKLDDPLPDERQGRRGWWGDATLDGTGNPSQQLGSRLWLLSRAKTTQQALLDAKKYISESLQWLIDDGVAANIDVTTERKASSTSPDILAFAITLKKPDGITVNFAYDYAWQLGQLERPYDGGTL